MSFRNWIGNVWNSAKKHAPGILTGLGISAMLTGTVLAVKATPEAMRRIEEKKKEEGHEELTFLQTLQVTWKCYLAALAAEFGGVGCLIAALKEGEKRQAALAMGWNAAENGLREFQEYRRFVAEKIGEKKEAEIHNQAIQEVVNQNPPPAMMIPGNEQVEGQAPKPLCCIPYEGRYVYMDYETAKAAVNTINYRITSGLEGYASLNDLYYEMHVSSTPNGDMIGWSTETGLIEIPEKEDLRYVGSPQGWPCWVLDFINPPQYEYKFFRKH